MIKKLLTILSTKEKKIFFRLIIILIFTVILEMLSVGIILPTLAIILDKSKSFIYLEKFELSFLDFVSKDNLNYFILLLFVVVFVLKNLALP